MFSRTPSRSVRTGGLGGGAVCLTQWTFFSFRRELTKVTKGFCRGRHRGWKHLTDASLSHFPTQLSTGDWEPGCLQVGGGGRGEGLGLWKTGTKPVLQCLPAPQGTPLRRPHSGWAQPQGNQHEFSPRGWFYFQSLISRPRIFINWSYSTWPLSLIEGECLILNYVARLPVYSNTCTKYDLPPWNYILIWSHIIY